MSLFELLPTGFVPTGPYATTIVEQAPAGTSHVKVIVVPDFVPWTVVLPTFELLMTTSACVAPARSASVTPLIVPVIESPIWTFHFVRFWGSPVPGSPPVGRSRLPGAVLSVSDLAAGASTRTQSTNTATSHDVAAARGTGARSSPRSVIPLIAANPFSPLITD
jgi:hypothetical protein